MYVTRFGIYDKNKKSIFIHQGLVLGTDLK